MTVLGPILKYTPAGVLGLLVGIWVVSPFVGIAVGQNGANGVVVEVSGGDLWIYLWITNHAIGDSYYAWITPQPRTYFGRFQWPTSSIIGCPLPFVITLLLPVVVGSNVGFRYRLWQYLIYTALVAVELAYYLRWR